MFSVVATIALTGCESTPAPTTEAGDEITQDTVSPRLNEADAAMRSGDYDVALGLFREILAANPTVVPAYMGIGDIYLKKGEYEKAEPAFARAARFEPANFDAQYGHGLALQMLRRFTEAIRAYHLALSIDPDSAKANRGLATVHLQIEEAQNALIYAERAVMLEPGHGGSRVNLGAVYEKLGRHGEAIDEYLAALEIMEPNEPLMLNLIDALGKEGRYQEAVETAENLVSFSPTANAYERLGWALFRVTDYAGSLAAYRRAVEINPNHWPSLNGVGVNALNAWLLSERSDRASYDEARQALRRSLQVNPGQMRIVTLMSHYSL